MFNIALNDKSKKVFKMITACVVLILLAAVVWLGWQYVKDQKELKADREALQVEKTNKNVLTFAQLFVEKVLRAQGEISFDTRLELENSVRSTADDQIVNQWTKFSQSQTEADAQQQVKDLLDLLITKIRVN